MGLEIAFKKDCAGWKRSSYLYTTALPKPALINGIIFYSNGDLFVKIYRGETDSELLTHEHFLEKKEKNDEKDRKDILKKLINIGKP